MSQPPDHSGKPPGPPPGPAPARPAAPGAPRPPAPGAPPRTMSSGAVPASPGAVPRPGGVVPVAQPLPAVGAPPRTAQPPAPPVPGAAPAPGVAAPRTAAPGAPQAQVRRSTGGPPPPPPGGGQPATLPPGERPTMPGVATIPSAAVPPSERRCSIAGSSRTTRPSRRTASFWHPGMAARRIARSIVPPARGW